MMACMPLGGWLRQIWVTKARDNGRGDRLTDPGWERVDPARMGQVEGRRIGRQGQARTRPRRLPISQAEEAGAERIFSTGVTWAADA